ncbi:MAG TPA: hypothetical protein VJ375_01810 [Gaiellaceae bacterium]|nr:hypothetical protein [Gaiellaceae bacterium]
MCVARHDLQNALQVNKIKASRTPTPGMLPPLDATGKLPASVAAVGPKGDTGAEGDTGAPGSKDTASGAFWGVTACAICAKVS